MPVTGRELVEAVRHEAAKSARSPRWRTVARRFLKVYPTCAACGSRRWLAVHHAIPFAVDPSLELVNDNLITLCLVGKQDHRLLGHGGAWVTHNPAVRADAEELLEHPRRRARIEARAKVTRRRARGPLPTVGRLRLAWESVRYVLERPSVLLWWLR